MNLESAARELLRLDADATPGPWRHSADVRPESSPPRDPRGEDVNYIVAADWTGSYVAPEHLAAVPADWFYRSGVALPVPVPRSWGAFSPFVIRRDPRRSKIDTVRTILCGHGAAAGACFSHRQRGMDLAPDARG